MDPKDMKLPPDFNNQRAGLDPAWEKIYRILWSVDPSVFRRFNDNVLTDVTQINVTYQAKQARLEAQSKINEAEAYEAISKIIASPKAMKG